MRRLKLAAIVVILLAAVAAVGWAVSRRGTEASGGIRLFGNIEVTDAEVAFKIPGRVQERLFDEGQSVEKGTVIAVLDSSDLQWEKAMRQAELEQAQAALAELQAGSRPEEIAAAEAAVRKAEATVSLLESGSWQQEITAAEATLSRAIAEKDRAEAEYGRMRQLFEQKVVSQDQFDRSKATFEVALAQWREATEQLNLVKGPRAQQIEEAKAALDEARARYELVKKGPRQEQIDQAQAKVNQAKAAYELAEVRLGYATLRAPMSGVVLSKNIEPGEYVSPGTPVVTVGDLEHVWLRAYLEQSFVGRVTIGQKARVYTDSHPDKPYEGRVSFIASEAEFTPKSVQTEEERVKLVYRIKIDLKNPRRELLPGMPADAMIEVGVQ